MTRITVNYQIAHAAAWDAGTRHARKAGRKTWNEEDYNAAVEQFYRLYPDPTGTEVPHAPQMETVHTETVTPDIRVQNHGSIFLFLPETDTGREWLRENADAEEWQWLTGALAVEARYAWDLAEGAVGDGLVVE